MGTGVFLLEAAAMMRRRFLRQLATTTDAVEDQQRHWNRYVTEYLLPRLCGQELLLPALVLAQLAMSIWLAETGFQFNLTARLQLHLANTLYRPPASEPATARLQGPFTVIVGNPPFAGVSDNREKWLRQLLRGKSPDSNTDVANYFLAQGVPLGERKHWLEDDYVKFFRFAHWQIEKANAGIVALVTNHGYLDNSTFRGMREQLLQTFDNIDIVDLHGNSRSGERPPNGVRDESVFGIEQGVTLSFLRRGVTSGQRPSIHHSELWGPAADKRQRLAETSKPLSTQQVIPVAPHFFFVPKAINRCPEYESGHRLIDIMPVNSTAAVTARDTFVVDIDHIRLRERLQQFADPMVSDETIRSEHFGNTRSRKYPPGDTRGWKLPAARRRLQAEVAQDKHVRQCLYRPFDRRHIFWVPWMIDWPRHTVMDHLLDGQNLALIARRQSPPSVPCEFFWVTDMITLDGVIRSDNRGSESLFPLFLTDQRRGAQESSRKQQTSGDKSAWRRTNFSSGFLKDVEMHTGLTWTTDGTEGPDTVTPHDLFHYIYALFFDELPQAVCRLFVRRFPSCPDSSRSRSVPGPERHGADHWSRPT